MMVSPSQTSAPRTAASKRTRTGCWNCRRRRKKCDDQRPTCSRCQRTSESCEWGIRLFFRDDNAMTISSNHPSMRQQLETADHFDILDITDEVVRDYWNELYGLQTATDEPLNDAAIQAVFDDLLCAERPSLALSPQISRDSLGKPPSSYIGLSSPPSSAPFSAMDGLNGVLLSPPEMNYHSAAAGLLELSGLGPPLAPESSNLMSIDGAIADANEALNLTPFTSISSPIDSPDGIFVPGSTYLQLHSTLRSHMFDTARSRVQTPDLQEPNTNPLDTNPNLPVQVLPEHINRRPSLPADKQVEGLTQEMEYDLWKNWTDEIASWLDKFDDQSHFGRSVPLLAQQHPHLRYSVLALSARQLERKNNLPTQSISLALYQEAVRQLILCLDQKTSAVVASCVILCVLEMMSCSPRMWRRHLEGCAALIQSLDITGFSGGLDQALFWCFARMDMCGGLINSEKTLIPAAYWAQRAPLPDAVKMFHRNGRPDNYASFMVFLCAHVLELLSAIQTNVQAFSHSWNKLFGHIEDWYANRPAELKPVLELRPTKDDHTRPFPTILFSNPPAISGNQLYHTAAILMLQKRPKSVHLRQKPRSVLWHARQVCAISISNTHHGCWINAVQPLWIAGQVMSNTAEHRAILATYRRIEQETGWGAEWRAKDLEEFWEDSDEE